MSVFSDINKMRKSGNLDEALQMANQALVAEPDNIWNKRAAAWVYHEYLKKNNSANHYEAFIENLTKIKELQLPEEEKMLFDSCAWQTGKIIFALLNEKNFEINKIDQLFATIKDFNFTKPSDAYSFLFKAFLKVHQNWSSFLEFADWWDFDNFQSTDYLPEEYNGRKLISIVEQAYIAYSKMLLEGEITEEYKKKIFKPLGAIPKKVNKEKVESFLPKLSELVENHPEYQYPSFYLAKLLLALGENENILSAFLPFAKRKKNEFWIWDILADIHKEDENLQFACYCKALSLNTPEKFLVKLREKFAEILIDKKMYDEARTEIAILITTRQEEQWPISDKIIGWTKEEWFGNNFQYSDNKELYLKHIDKAEELLYNDIAEEVVVVEFVNKHKHILNFIKNKDEKGFFKYEYHLKNPKIGDVIKVRFAGNSKEGFYKIHTLKLADESAKSEALKDFEGNIKVISPQNFGLIGDVFVDNVTVEKNNFTNGQKIKGKAILSFNKKKNEWGWKVISITDL